MMNFQLQKKGNNERLRMGKRNSVFMFMIKSKNKRKQDSEKKDWYKIDRQLCVMVHDSRRCP